MKRTILLVLKTGTPQHVLIACSPRSQITMHEYLQFASHGRLALNRVSNEVVIDHLKHSLENQQKLLQVQ